ncbi:endonuclease/exonuclease/phosphatase family protein [Bacteriovoracaceae bacterium]|nr:endonuclease/exonuclease/phosphatase family protein [Bacteriovoracaceae bacterium]
MVRLKVLSYNIHKGLSFGNFKQTLPELKERIQTKHFDFIFLQEVVGDHQHKSKVINNYHNNSHYEYLAKDEHHFRYGKNAVYDQGHHGNAILSTYPVLKSNNVDLTINDYEYRGLLHIISEVEKTQVHLFCTHINLLHLSRMEQVERIIKYIERIVPDEEPIIFCGDFNDWPGKLSAIFKERLNLDEGFLNLYDSHAKTFPSFLPFLPLDRMYYRNLKIVNAKTIDHSEWKHLSDHVAIFGEFEFQ